MPQPYFIPGQRTPSTDWIGGWVGLTAGLDTEATVELHPDGDQTLVVQSAVSHYTDRDTVAPKPKLAHPCTICVS
jgi:hypothetical protein